MSDLDPMSQLDLEREIRRLSHELSRQTEENAQRAEAAARAEADYKLAAARCMLDLRGKGGTVAEKEAEVLDTCMVQFQEAKLTEAVHKAVQEKGRNLRAQLDALRTLNANLRDAVAHPTGRGG